MSETNEFMMDRAQKTQAVMVQLSKGYGWVWSGVSPGNYGNEIEAVLQLEESAEDAATELESKRADLNAHLAAVHEDTKAIKAVGEIDFKASPSTRWLFERLSASGQAQEEIYQAALRAESAMQKANPLWAPTAGLHHAAFKLKREAINTKEVLLSQADTAEADARHRHDFAVEGLNATAVDFYQVATGVFGPHTTQGQLVRTIPTTYDPNQPPGGLFFTFHLAPAPSQVELHWRATRGQHYDILAQGPGAAAFEKILDHTAERKWMGQGLAAGGWKFKGRAFNAHGAGAESLVVEITVTAAQAA